MQQAAHHDAVGLVSVDELTARRADLELQLLILAVQSTDVIESSDYIRVPASVRGNAHLQYIRMAQMQNVRQLIIEDGDFPDELLIYVRNMQSLRRLEIRRRWTPVQLHHLCDGANPPAHLQYIDLSTTTLTDAHIAHLMHLRTLTSIEPWAWTDAALAMMHHDSFPQLRRLRVVLYTSDTLRPEHLTRVCIEQLHCLRVSYGDFDSAAGLLFLNNRCRRLTKLTLYNTHLPYDVTRIVMPELETLEFDYVPPDDDDSDDDIGEGPGGRMGDIADADAAANAAANTDADADADAADAEYDERPVRMIDRTKLIGMTNLSHFNLVYRV